LPNVGCHRETLARGKQGRLPYTLGGRAFSVGRQSPGCRMSDVTVKLWPVASRAARPTRWAGGLFLWGDRPRLPNVGCHRETLARGKQGRSPYTLGGRAFSIGRPARLPNVGCHRETLARGKQGRLPYTLGGRAFSVGRPAPVAKCRMSP